MVSCQIQQCAYGVENFYAHMIGIKRQQRGLTFAWVKNMQDIDAVSTISWARFDS